MLNSIIFYLSKGGVIISRIPFLHNAESGKNNLWRYLLTIAVTVMPFVVALVIVFVVSLFLIIQSGTVNLMNQLNGILHNPLALLLITIIIYVFMFIAFYFCIRFIHKRQFISLINTKSKINWMKILKGAGLWLAILGIFTVISLLFTSIIFAVLHAGNGTNMLINIFIVLEVLIVGITFGIIALGENRIETAIGVHISNNIYAFLIVGSSDEVINGLPSVFTTTKSTLPDLYIGLITTILEAIILLSILFWGKKDKLLNIFRWEDA
jgi:membrane protease YdiL (CAAX protease family)